MYTTWKKLIIMIIIIRFGIEPGLNKTIIPTVSNNFMLVWMMNTRSIILEQGGVWVLERFYLLFSFLFWLKTYYIICYILFCFWKWHKRPSPDISTHRWQSLDWFTRQPSSTSKTIKPLLGKSYKDWVTYEWDIGWGL